MVVCLVDPARYSQFENKEDNYWVSSFDPLVSCILGTPVGHARASQSKRQQHILSKPSYQVYM